MFNWLKKQAIQKRVEDAILYEYVADELEDGIKIKGLWAKAYAQSGGDSDAVEPLYMQYRVQSIKDFFTAMKIAYEELPKSKISKYLDNQSTQETKNIINHKKCGSCNAENENSAKFCTKCGFSFLKQNVEVKKEKVVDETVSNLSQKERDDLMVSAIEDLFDLEYGSVNDQHKASKVDIKPIDMDNIDEGYDDGDTIKRIREINDALIQYNKK